METKDILQEFKSLRPILKKLETIQKIEINNFTIEHKLFNTTTKSIHSFSKIDLSSNSTSTILEKKKLENPKLAYIYDLISSKPISINDICKKTSKSISQISNDLFSLELGGYIKKVAGGYICILNN